MGPSGPILPVSPSSPGEPGLPTGPGGPAAPGSPCKEIPQQRQSPVYGFQKTRDTIMSQQQHNHVTQLLTAAPFNPGKPGIPDSPGEP